MGYKSLTECLKDLERHGQLVRVSDEVSPDLEMAEIQRRAYAAKAPAILFERVKGSPFRAVCNLFGTMERCRFIFRDTIESVQFLMKLKADLVGNLKDFKKMARLPGVARLGFYSIPKQVKGGPILQNQTRLSMLPQIKSWPEDGGAFITLPQVYSEDPYSPDVVHSNLGMYRVQISGNLYEKDREAGLHYQIHRGIGVHHARAIEKGEPLKVSIFVGGPPAHTVAAVMPLPEGLSELMFAGMLGARRFRYIRHGGHVISADADFCITGTVDNSKTKPEGPFGDHLGYYSLVHPFPYLKIEKIWCRKDAIWPFTVVGRPPQEDTTFGKLIHDITAPVVPVEIPGLKAIHAVDEAGVHPLLLAIGSERYVPYREREPMELLTIANALLGFGQCSLAKYLFIAAWEDNPDLDVNDIEGFFMHILERVDWTRDLHFYTKTTIDTLDYSGCGLNRGSKLVVAAAGEKRRNLGGSIPKGLILPQGYKEAYVAMPGILVVSAPRFSTYDQETKLLGKLERTLENGFQCHEFPLVVLVDDARFVCQTLANFLWVTFTRSNPSHDIYGVGSFIEHKHWGCTGSIIIDARLKPHHAPPLEEDPRVTRRVDRLAARGGPLHGII